MKIRLILKPSLAGVVDAIGGGPVLVKNRRPIFRANEQFRADQLLTRTARSAVGQLRDGRFLFVTIDGAQPGYSAGATNFELALEMVKLGAVTAAALDAGHSSELAFEGTPLSRVAGPERPIANALVAAYTGVYLPPPAEEVLSPNGDGVADRQTLGYKLVRQSQVTVSLLGPDGQSRESFSGKLPPGMYPFAWSGLNADGIAEVEGRWRWIVTATDDRGQTSKAERDFDLNDTLGFPVGAQTPLTIPRRAPRVVAAFKLSRAATVTTRIKTSSGVVLRSFPKQQATAGRRVRRLGRPHELGRRRLFGPLRRRGDRGQRPRAGDARRDLRPQPPASTTAPKEETAAKEEEVESPRLVLASITSFVGDHGVYAVFVLMLAAAVVPAASELVMVYAGAVAGGAFASAHVVLFGHRIDTPAWAYVTMAVTGVLANTIGAVIGWGIGDYGGRPLLERHGKWLHVTPAADRPRGALVRPLRRARGAARHGHAGRSQLRRDPRRDCPDAALALRPARPDRLHPVLLRARRRRLGARLELRPPAPRLQLRLDRDRCPRGGRNRLPDLAQAVLYTGNAPMIPLVDVKAQYAPLIPALKERVGEVIDSGRFILGPNVAAFEEEVAAYLGVPETIGVANGTDALVLALDAMEIGPGDEVICPSFTFYATCGGDRQARRDARVRRHRARDDEPRP